MAATRRKTTRLIINVRVCYDDGLAAYFAVDGVANGEDAIQLARQQAEMERADVHVYTASVVGIEEEDQA